MDERAPLTADSELLSEMAIELGAAKAVIEGLLGEDWRRLAAAGPARAWLARADERRRRAVEGRDA